MIAVSVSKAYVETLDGKDSDGFCLDIQIWRLMFQFAITWGKK